MVREYETPAFFSSRCPLRLKFVSFVRQLERIFGAVLPVPVIRGDNEGVRVKALKKFCGGLIEGQRDHLWHDPTMKLSRDSRMSIGMSLFLFRKVLPSEEPDLQAYFEKMTRESDCPDEEFLRYVERRVPELFPPGWDLTRYPNAALNSVIPIKSCLQKGLGSGGARLEVLDRPVGWNCHQDYVLEVLSRESPVELLPSRLAAVETAGKYRIVSVGDVEMNLFRPLHTAIYNHLSSFNWLLRGDAKPGRFKKEFCRKTGEVFCSGDYESATDNLNSVVQKLILRLILYNSVSVPRGIASSALDLLSTKITSPAGEVAEQKRGQLMGNLLSFPLLCIVNYLAFRFYSRTKGPDVPVRVNGDDIVFRATPEVVSRWMEGVGGSGLTLSRGKTMVDRTYFSLNSCLFKASEANVSVVPFVRATALWPRLEAVSSLRGRYGAFAVGFHGRRRFLWREYWLRQNRKYILASRRSCSRGLGLLVSKPLLIAAGLWDRECFYLSFPDGVEKPIPSLRSVLDQQRVPVDWERRPVDKMTKELRSLQRDCAAEFVACAWSRATYRGRRDDLQFWWRQLLDGAIQWHPVDGRPGLLRKSRLLGLSPRNVTRYLRPRVSEERIRQIVTRNRIYAWVPRRYSRIIWPQQVLSTDPRMDPESGRFDPIGLSAEMQCYSAWRDGEWVGFLYPPPRVWVHKTAPEWDAGDLKDWEPVYQEHPVDADVSPPFCVEAMASGHQCLRPQEGSPPNTASLLRHAADSRRVSVCPTVRCSLSVCS